MCTVNDMRCKEVVNVRDGQRLGFVDDLEIDEMTGSVLSLIVPGPAKILGLFGKDGNYVIPWNQIQKIGNDIILINFETTISSAPKKGNIIGDLFK